MTKRTFPIGTAIAPALLGVLFALPGHASDIPLRMSIPFRFIAGDTVMPPGTYRVSLSEIARSIVFIGEQKAVRVPVGVPGILRRQDRTDWGTLLFDRIGATYVLRSAWNANRAEGCAVYRSKRLDRDLARATGAVVLAAE